MSTLESWDNIPGEFIILGFIGDIATIGNDVGFGKMKDLNFCIMESFFNSKYLCF